MARNRKATAVDAIIENTYKKIDADETLADLSVQDVAALILTPGTTDEELAEQIESLETVDGHALKIEGDEVYLDMADEAEDEGDGYDPTAGVGEPFDTGEDEEAPVEAPASTAKVETLLWITSTSADVVLATLGDGLVVETIKGGARTPSWIKVTVSSDDNLAPITLAVQQAITDVGSKMSAEQDKILKDTLRAAVKALKSFAGYIERAPAEFAKKQATIAKRAKK